MRVVSALLGALALTACQHTQTVTPAVLADAETSTMDALRASLASAMGRAEIEFGAGDPTMTPSVAVLPPKPSSFETQSPAMPTLFELYMRGETCFAIRQGDDIEIALPGVPCRVAS